VHRTQEPGSGDSANAPLGCILAGDPKKKGRIGRDTLIWPHRDGPDLVPPDGRGCRCDGLILSQAPTRRAGCDGLNWPGLIVDHRRTGDHGRGRTLGSR